MTEYIDTHAHLYWERFDEDRAAVLDRARAAGFVHVINIGTDLDTSRAAIQLARRQPGFCFATVGLHPTDTNLSPETLDDVVRGLRELATEHPAQVRGIGETGLDFYWDRSPPAAQDRAFRRQLELAEELDLPVVIHCRDAMGETLEVVTGYAGRVRGVFHCFGGDAGDAERALDLGWHVSFAGNVTFPKAEELREAARAVPVERLLLETDAPFLAPQPVRGQRNEPVFALHTLEALARLHGRDPEELAAITTRNARELFRLPPIS